MASVHFPLLAQRKMDEKERAPRENGPDYYGRRDRPVPLEREATLKYGGSYIAEEIPKVASSCNLNIPVEGERDSIFARGTPDFQSADLMMESAI